MPATADELDARLRAFAGRRRAAAPSLDRLDPSGWPEAALAATVLVWSRRVVNERRSVELALEMARALERTPLGASSLAPALARLADDERGHVDLASAFLARLGAPVPDAEPEPAGGTLEPTHTFLLRCATTGLAVCETVSAVRFAMVRRHTDLTIPRVCIEHFLRDEIAHARLGFAVLPTVLAHHSRMTDEHATSLALASELRETFRHLDVVVGLDADRRGLRLTERPQPPCNAGVVEPALDAIAFRAAITGTVIPRLARLGVDAATIWAKRWDAPSQPT